MSNKPALDAETEKCLENEHQQTRIPSVYVAALLCPKKVAGLPDAQKLGPFATREKAEAFLDVHLSGQPDLAAAHNRYRENLDQLLASSPVGPYLDQAASVHGQLQDSGIELWPSPYPGWPTRQELPGLLVSSALLSLGAPFWFNLLKTLTNLRPLVATREENDRQQRDKKTKA